MKAALSCAVIGAALTLLSPSMGAAQPVHFSKLLPFLPDQVEGFTAQKPDGSTTSMSGFSMSQVSREYRKGEGEGEQRVTLKISDGTGNEAFKAMHAAMPEFSNETTEGYEKGFKLDGNPAVEKYNTEGKDGQLTVFLGGQFLVEVEIDGLEKEALQAWLKKIDVKKLVATKP